MQLSILLGLASDVIRDQLTRTCQPQSSLFGEKSSRFFKFAVVRQHSGWRTTRTDFQTRSKFPAGRESESPALAFGELFTAPFLATGFLVERLEQCRVLGLDHLPPQLQTDSQFFSADSKRRRQDHELLDLLRA